MSDRAALLSLKNALSERIIGQEHLIQRLLIALLANGHLLVEGAPASPRPKPSNVSLTGLKATFIASSLPRTCYLPM